jgi:uncharacterized protein YoxC
MAELMEITLLADAIKTQSSSIDKMRDELSELKTVVVEVNAVRKELNDRIDHEVSERNHLIKEHEKRLNSYGDALKGLSFWSKVSANPKIYVFAAVGVVVILISDFRHPILKFIGLM